MPPEEQSGKLGIGEYTIHLRNVLLPMDLQVDDVRLTGKSISVSRHPFAVTVSEEGGMRVHVSDASLAAFLEKQSPAGLKRFHVIAHEGKLIVHAIKKVLVELKAKAVCTLEIRQGREVHVLLESVDVAGADIRNLIQTQLDKLNPVIDIGMFPFQAKIDSVEAAHGGITLVGRITP